MLFGQAIPLLRSDVGTLEREWAEEYGPRVRFIREFGSEVMIFMKPDVLNHIMVKEWLNYPRPSYLRNILGLVTGYGLLTVTGEEHKQMRRAMNPAFSLQNLLAQTPMYYKPIERLISIFKNIAADQEGCSSSEAPIINVYEWLSKVTLDIICETAFNYDINSLEDPHNELAEAYHFLLSFQSVTNLAKLIVLVNIPGGSRVLASEWAYNRRNLLRKLPVLSPIGDFVDAMYRIKTISKRMLAEKMQDANLPISDMDAKRDIMSILVRARKTDMLGGKSGYAMSDRAMVDQVLTFLGAGHETTASGLTWALWHLANSKEHQEHLRGELTNVFLQNSRPDYRDLKDLQWLDAIMMESLRLMPPVPGTAREAAKSDYIDGVFVPKGTLIYIPIRALNTWKSAWGPDAAEFNPSRWFSLSKDHLARSSFYSFITGPHACIGKTMSIIEMKMVLSFLIYEFEFEPAFEGQKARPASAITMKPTDGMPLRVKRVNPPRA